MEQRKKQKQNKNTQKKEKKEIEIKIQSNTTSGERGVFMMKIVKGYVSSHGLNILFLR